MTEMTWTVTAPYLQCFECKHPGPPTRLASLTLAQPNGADVFHFVPHFRGCSCPNPFNGPSTTVRFNAEGSP